MTGLWSVALTLSVIFGGQTPRRIPPPDYKGKCADAGCHEALVKRPVVHDPLVEEACDQCHQSADAAEHRFKLAAEGAALCTECHDPFTARVQHDPVAGGACTTCHDPHGGTSKQLLSHPSESELCESCHDDVTEGLRRLHGPVAAGTCVVCHDPHAAEQADLLRGPIRELCFKCHRGTESTFTDKAHVHAPAMDACTGCHRPHGSDEGMMLVAAPPALCLSCHDDIAEQAAKATVQHSAVAGGSACPNCHESHASEVKFLLKQDPLNVCLSCHDRPLDGKGGPLRDFKKLLADGPHRHGPLSDGDCATCHREVHGGRHFRLLSGNYPATLYSPFAESEYALCFDCHEAEAFREPETERATAFRNGSQNLHYLHVNRKEKGRTCRTCHEVHAGKSPKHMAESVPFGEWQIPIGFAPTPSGGLCQPGCHRPYGYDRESPVVNGPSAASPPAAGQQP